MVGKLCTVVFELTCALWYKDLRGILQGPNIKSMEEK